MRGVNRNGPGLPPNEEAMSAQVIYLYPPTPQVASLPALLRDMEVRWLDRMTETERNTMLNAYRYLFRYGEDGTAEYFNHWRAAYCVWRRIRLNQWRV